ncbi:MAG: 2-C-methyl-D-erythritol 2,4-cyclodiphosphate synthase [Ignavibacteriales bacterium]|nr:2-C-methyl-D-erythritol 2,4-cyclodiphosphate synthase [Ignavibacteriales bacterium]
MRVGIGYDVHRFDKGRKLYLGGVRIPSQLGLVGHSDADVLIHAICDALLGAAGLGDIGKHFPDTSPQYKGIASTALLKKVIGLLREKDFVVGNVDATVILQRPKIAPYVDRMKSHLAKTLRIDRDVVSIKATTNEGIGSLGRSEGCAAFAVATIVPQQRD